jgi:predicted HTH domain antitoxin
MTELEAVEALLASMKRKQAIDDALSEGGVKSLSEKDRAWLRMSLTKVSKWCEDEDSINKGVEYFASYLEETAQELRAIDVDMDYMEDMTLSMQINILAFFQKMKSLL